jgi:hypothetical protein
MTKSKNIPANIYDRTEYLTDVSRNYPQRKHSMTTKKATRSHSGCCQLTVFLEFQDKKYFISHLSVSP